MVPGIYSNEKADDLEKKECFRPFVGPQPRLGLFYREAVWKWTEKKQMKYWKTIPGHKYSKLLIG